MARLTIKNVAAPDLSSTSQILDNANQSLNRGLDSASQLLGKYKEGQQEISDNKILSDISGLSSEEDLDNYINSGALNQVNVSPKMRENILNLRKGFINNNLVRTNTNSAAASTAINNAVERRTESNYQDKITKRDNLRQLTPLVIAANKEGIDKGKGFTRDAPSSLLGTESGGKFSAKNNAIGSSGKRGHFGRVQFGQDRLIDLKKAGVVPYNMTSDEFLKNEDVQVSAENWHFKDIQKFINTSNLDRYIGQTINGVEVTRDGLVAAAHLGGKGGMRQFILSNGQYDKADANGTKLSDYLRIHAGNTTSRTTSAPAAQTLSDAITDSNLFTPSEASTFINGVNKSQATGQNNINESLGTQNNSNDVPPLKANISPESIAISNSVELYNRREDARVDSTVQNRVISRADSFNADPTGDIIKLLNIGSDGETPRSNWFFADHDKNTLRTIVNNVAQKANVTPKIAASALVEIFERDPFGNNSDANRFDEQDAVNFIRTNMSQDAVNKYERDKVVSEGNKRQVNGLLLRLNTLKNSSTKYGGNPPPQVVQAIRQLEFQINELTSK